MVCIVFALIFMCKKNDLKISLAPHNPPIWGHYGWASKQNLSRISCEIEKLIVKWFASFLGPFLCLQKTLLEFFSSPPHTLHVGPYSVGLATRTCKQNLRAGSLGASLVQEC